MLSFRELVRFGYQQNITPALISPEDLVYVYKKLVRESTDGITKSGDHVSNTMLDYEAFKKCIVRISILAQEKLDQSGNKQSLRQNLADKKNENRKR